jgi:hypothetical protein
MSTELLAVKRGIAQSASLIEQRPLSVGNAGIARRNFTVTVKERFDANLYEGRDVRLNNWRALRVCSFATIRVEIGGLSATVGQLWCQRRT